MPNSTIEQLVETFKNDMLREINNNSHKGNILDDEIPLTYIIAEFEYHKAKMLLAARLKHKKALREYIADTANFLLLIGKYFDVYNLEIDYDTCFEINKEVPIFKLTNINNQSTGQLE